MLSQPGVAERTEREPYPDEEGKVPDDGEMPVAARDGPPPRPNPHYLPLPSFLSLFIFAYIGDVGGMMNCLLSSLKMRKMTHPLPLSTNVRVEGGIKVSRRCCTMGCARWLADKGDEWAVAM